jgi:hypothetical protein
MLFWFDYKLIGNTNIWYNSGMSRIPPIPPQSDIAVYLILCTDWYILGVGLKLSRDF